MEKKRKKKAHQVMVCQVKLGEKGKPFNYDEFIQINQTINFNLYQCIHFSHTNQQEPDIQQFDLNFNHWLPEMVNNFPERKEVDLCRTFINGVHTRLSKSLVVEKLNKLKVKYLKETNRNRI